MCGGLTPMSIGNQDKRGGKPQRQLGRPTDSVVLAGEPCPAGPPRWELTTPSQGSRVLQGGGRGRGREDQEEA